MKHIRYPKIGYFRNVAKTLIQRERFIGFDDNDEPIYKDPERFPIVRFNGTVKLHGTNGGVCYNSNDGIWHQSRERILSIDDDNAGFSFFAQEREMDFLKIILNIISKEQVNPHINDISIFGEFVGKKIQSGVAISQMDKSFFIFGIKISPHNRPFGEPYWIDARHYKNEEKDIYNVYDYKKYIIDVDLNRPEDSIEEIEQKTKEVEELCPISKAFGIEGVGEGIVWQACHGGANHRFKTKGEKHAVRKSKSIAEVSPEKLKSIKDFVDYSVTENRLEQAVANCFEEEISTKMLGCVLKWIVKDILEEEGDVLIKSRLEPNDVKRALSHRAKQMFFDNYV